MEEKVLEQVLKNVGKHIAGVINSRELYQYLYVISKEQLNILEQKNNQKLIDKLV